MCCRSFTLILSSSISSSKNLFCLLSDFVLQLCEDFLTHINVGPVVQTQDKGCVIFLSRHQVSCHITRLKMSECTSVLAPSTLLYGTSSGTSQELLIVDAYVPISTWIRSAPWFPRPPLPPNCFHSGKNASPSLYGYSHLFLEVFNLHHILFCLVWAGRCCGDIFSPAFTMLPVLFLPGLYLHGNQFIPMDSGIDEFEQRTP